MVSIKLSCNQSEIKKPIRVIAESHYESSVVQVMVAHDVAASAETGLIL